MLNYWITKSFIKGHTDKKIMKNKSVIVTTTFYNNSEEGNLRKGLANNFFEEALTRGYPVVAVDGGTEDGKYLEELKDLGVHAFPETLHGLGGSRREAMNYATQIAKENGQKYLVWSEPEKVDFVRLISSLEDEMESTGAKIIVPKRKSLEGYPSAQQNSEQFGNQLHTDAGYLSSDGLSLDTFFGPKIWEVNLNNIFQRFGKKDISRYLAEMRKNSTKVSKQEIENAQTYLMRTDHAQHMPICSASLDDSIKVLSLSVDYEHPKTQTILEEKNQEKFNQKRLIQLNALNEQFQLVKYMQEKEVL